MKLRIAWLLLAALTLAACDKCGEFGDIRVPGAPKACADRAR